MNAPHQPILSAPYSLRQLGRVLCIALLFAAALMPRAARAQATPTPPERMSYQGYVTDGNGVALGTNAPKNYDVIFRIWNDQSATAAANRLWAEQQTVTVDKGYFSVLLGEGSQYASEPHASLSGLFAGTDASERYVEFTVKGIGSGGADVTILPRLKLLSSPYAFLARNASTLMSPNGASLVTSANGQLTVNGSISGDGSGLTALNASQLTTGTVPGGRLGGTYSGAVTLNNSGNSFSGNGSGLIALNASGIASGTLGDARLSANVALRAGGNSFFGNQYVTAGALYLDNSQYLYAKNATGTYESFLMPRYSDNVTYLNFGTGGFNLRNNASASRMFLTDGGNVGIGTTAPAAPLHLVSAGWPSAIAESSSTVGTWVSLRNTTSGGHNWNLISSGSGNGEGAGKLLLNDQTVGTTVMTLQSNNRVGIGTATPGYPLEVSGFANYDLGGGFWYAFTSGSGIAASGSHINSITIKASNGIQTGSGLYVTSDQRTKMNLTKSDSAKDLATLTRLQVTDYNFVDRVSYGDTHKKGLIAQEVEKVFPQAVNQHTDVIPDIYKPARCQNGWVELATTLKKGERVRLVAAKADGIHEVLEVTADKFRTDFTPEVGELFVFGREVKDFRALDYNAIGVLNISATQELARRLEKLETREAHVAALEQKAARVMSLEREVDDLKKLVAKLAEAGNGAKHAARAKAPTATEVAQQSTSAAADLNQ